MRLQLGQTCTIQRFTSDAGPAGQDDYGNEVAVGGWTTLCAVACRVELMFSEEDDIGRTVDFLKYRVFMAPADVTENDRLLLDSLDGRPMEIVGIDQEWGATTVHHLVVWGQTQRNQDPAF